MIFTLIVYSWTIGTFIKGFKRDLEVSDLTETLRTHRSDKLGDKLALVWEQEEVKASQKKRKPSLLWALTRVFGWELLMYGVLLAFAELGIR